MRLVILLSKFPRSFARSLLYLVINNSSEKFESCPSFISLIKKNLENIELYYSDIREFSDLEIEQNVDFVIQTPTSVASVKGTDFWMLVDELLGDQVIGIEGQVSLVNTETGQEVMVTTGMTGNSTPDGQIGVSETDVSSIPEDPSDESQEGPSQVRIYLEGPNGEQKVFIIDYQ